MPGTVLTDRDFKGPALAPAVMPPLFAGAGLMLAGALEYASGWRGSRGRPACEDRFFRLKERDRRRGAGPRIRVDRKPRASFSPELLRLPSNIVVVHQLGSQPFQVALLKEQ